MSITKFLCISRTFLKVCTWWVRFVKFDYFLPGEHKLSKYINLIYKLNNNDKNNNSNKSNPYCNCGELV